MSESSTNPNQLTVHDLTPESFHRELIGIRNTVAPDEPVMGFDANKNVIGQGVNGEIDGAGHRFPRGSDKLALLDYGLERAQAAANPADANIIAAATVVIVHPFLEANGRTTRAFYRKLQHNTPVTAAPREQGQLQDLAARAEIDLGSALNSDPQVRSFREQLICHETGLDFRKRNGRRVRVHRRGDNLTDLDRIALNEAQTAGLTEEEVADLSAAIGGDKFGNTYGTDTDGLSFASVAMETEGTVGDFVTDRGSFSLFDLQAYLESATPKEKKQFVDKLWQYRRLSAKAEIDLLSDEVGGSSLAVIKGEQMSVRDYVLGKMNHLKTPKTAARIAGRAAITA